MEPYDPKYTGREVIVQRVPPGTELEINLANLEPNSMERRLLDAQRSNREEDAKFTKSDPRFARLMGLDKPEDRLIGAAKVLDAFDRMTLRTTLDMRSEVRFSMKGETVVEWQLRFRVANGDEGRLSRSFAFDGRMFDDMTQAKVDEYLRREVDRAVFDVAKFYIGSRFAMRPWQDKT